MGPGDQLGALQAGPPGRLALEGSATCGWAAGLTACSRSMVLMGG